MFNVLNENGTPFELPSNPLQEKWDRLYPPKPMPQYSQVCDGYSCMWCGRCPKGDNWKVPQEDLEIWEQYQKSVHNYLILHNPEFTVTNSKNEHT